MKVQYTIGIIGVGRVGSAIGYTLRKNKKQIIGATDINNRKVKKFYRLLKIKYQYLNAIEIAKKSNLLFITTQDSQIEKVYQEILPYLRKRTVIIQCSGALSNRIFKNKKRKDIITIGLHPIQTFTSNQQSIKAIRNIYYAIEAEGEAKKIAQSIIKDLQGRPIFIKSKDKPLYHVMCVFASNYLVTLMSAVLDIANELEIKPTLAFKILTPLINQTFNNIKRNGVQKSLTGPIERGDIETIKTHFEILNKKTPELIPLYQTMGLKALDLLKSKKSNEH